MSKRKNTRGKSRSLYRSREIVIAKFGTTCVVKEDGIHQDRVNSITKRYTQLIRQGARLGIVSSGSVGAGRRKINRKRPELSEFLDLRAVAGLGSSSAYHAWARGFGRQEIDGDQVMTAQMLATHDDMDHIEMGASLVEVFKQYVNNGIVPIFNINDVLDRYKDESGKIAEGKDNDFTAAHLAKNVGAHTLLLLTAKVPGVIVDKKLVKQISVPELDDIEEHLSGTDEDGTGSMKSKISAGALALESGEVKEVFIGSAMADPREIMVGKAGTELVQ